MASLHDSGSRDPAAKRAGRGGRGEPKQKRAKSLGVNAGGGGGSSTPATAPAPESCAAVSLVDVTVEDPGALDCVVCYLPLKPPIFQCDVGHTVCSRCHDKLQATGKCPVCRVVTGKYHRCYVMERLVESIGVPCPYAAHGCALRPFYYDQESHRSMCVHAPCHCPGEECSFVGSTAAQLCRLHCPGEECSFDDSGSKDPAAKRAGRGGGGEPKQKRARSLGVDAGGSGGSSTPATTSTSESCAATSLVDVTVEDPNLPGIACDAGHAVCSRCRDKLQATGNCPVCRVVTSSYRRCQAMEQLVESIRVPCSYTAYGCALRPAYYDQESHRLVCEHAPCHCPGEACSFVGSTAALLDHCSTAHRWPCITTVKPDDDDEFTICLHDGFNFLLADCSTSNENQGLTASIQCLLLLTVARQPYACIISVHCIDPHAAMASGDQGPTSKEIQCQFRYSVLYKANYLYLHSSLYKDYSLDKDARSPSGKVDYRQNQVSRIRVVRTDLSNGLPKPDDCVQFVVPNSGIEDYDKDGIEIKVSIVIK